MRVFPVAGVHATDLLFRGLREQFGVEFSDLESYCAGKFSARVLPHGRRFPFGRKPFTFWLLGLCAVFVVAALLSGLSIGFVVDHIYSDQAGCYAPLSDDAIFPYIGNCEDGEEPRLHPLRYIPQAIFLLVSILLLTWLALVYRKRRKLQIEEGTSS